MLAPLSTLLPTTADIQRITGLTTNAYITSPPVPRRYRWINKVVRDSLENVTRDMQSVHCGWGQIRLRHSIPEKSNSWQAELFGDACALGN